MAEELITVRNTLNGVVAKVRPAILRNPHLAQHLVEVEEDAKPQILIKPSTSEEYVSRRRKKSDKNLTNEAHDETEEG